MVRCRRSWLFVLTTLLGAICLAASGCSTRPGAADQGGSLPISQAGEHARVDGTSGPLVSSKGPVANLIRRSQAVGPQLPRAASTKGGYAPYVDGEILVRFRAGLSSAEEMRAEHAVMARQTAAISPGLFLLAVPDGAVPQAIRILRSLTGVTDVEPNYYAEESATPNDPSYPLQWAADNTGQTVNGVAGTVGADEGTSKAWNVTTGSRSVVIGEVDTGVDYTDTDLAANIWTNPGGIGGCAAGTHGYNVLDSSCDPMDDDAVYGGHGTHVAGIMGAVGNNGVGVAGINWNTSILPVKWVDSSGSGTTAGLLEALNWLMQAKRAGVNIRIVNDSDVFVGTAYSQALSDTIDQLGASGILFVTAAGNSGQSDDSPSTRRYPCAYERPTEICVTASDQSDQLPSWANYGSTVDLAAPGSNIYSTLRNNSFGYLSGGSMAAPQVSGAAALILSTRDMTPLQVKADILENVDQVPAMAGMVRTGGRLDVCRAVASCGTPAVLGSPFNVSAPDLSAASSSGGGVSPEPETGQIIASTSGAWDGSPTSYTYQWLQCDSNGANCSPIVGATQSIYTPAGSQVGLTLMIQVRAANAAGSTVALSAPSEPVQPASPQGTFGKTTIGASSDPADANYERVDSFTVAANVALTKLTVYLDRANAGQQLFEGVIYGDESGAPGSLIAASGTMTFTTTAGSGWYDLDFSQPVSLTAGTYWIGILTGDTGDVANLRYDENVPGSGAVAAQSWTTGPATSFPSPRLQYEEMSIYATYGSSAAPTWSASVGVSTVSPTSGQGVVVTATANTEVSPNYYLVVLDQTTGQVVGSCSSGTACSATVTESVGGSHTFVAEVASSAAGSGPIMATSNPVTVTWTASLSSTFGVSTVGPNSDWMAANRKRVNSFTLGIAGAVSKLSMYLAPTGQSGSQTVQGVIYASGSNGQPSSLLGASKAIIFSSNSSPGWYDLVFPSTVSLAAGTYWIGVMSGDTSGVTGFRWTNVVGSRVFNGNNYSAGPTSTFGIGSTDSEEMSIYASYS